MATVPTEHTWAVGETVTAANMNANLRDATNFLIGGSSGQRPKFRVYRAATQSIANATETQVLWDTVPYDTDAGYSASTGLYTIVTAGVWLFQATSSWASNATGNRGIHLDANGTNAWQWVTGAMDGTGRSSVSLLTNCVAGQTVTSTVFQSSGGTLNFQNSDTTFGGIWLCS